MEDGETSICMPGYHNYRDVWDAVTGKELRCERQPDTNRSDRYVVTIKEWDNHRSFAV